MLRRVVMLLPLLLAGPAAAQETFLSPAQAVLKMKVPEGFRVQLVAGEPAIVKPMSMTTDDRGRLWVLESHSYPNWSTDGKKQGQDRILIFEEKADGTYSSKVFMDRGTNLSGLALGFGGVFLTAPPYLLFVPIKADADKPAGPAQILLDGWDVKAKHNVVNHPIWGPDGWLYGCNGILSNSRVGRPGCPEAERVAMNCGVWRYHPITRKFEQFASGTTNPWGLDFDEFGEMFITNCVIKHLFHVIPGARYDRMFGQDIHPHTYGLMPSCADHIHWGGGEWTSSRGGKGQHDSPGGGHAHAGALVYLGDNFPAEYRNHIFMCNLHGNRLNQDILESHGSGYVAHHGKDFLLAEDPWFRGLVLTAAADGGIFVADWHDTGECHNYDKTHPSGRIYKVTYGTPKRFDMDLARASAEELVKLQFHKDEWQVRHARRLLQESAYWGKIKPASLKPLWDVLDKKETAAQQLRAIWALHAVHALKEKDYQIFLSSGFEAAVRSWGVRLALEWRPSHEMLVGYLDFDNLLASPQVRLALASGLQRLPVGERGFLANALLQHGGDAADANIPLMIWYGIEPLAASDPVKATDLLGKARIPLVRQFMARRLTLLDARGIGPLVKLLETATDAGVQRDALRGMYDALQGSRNVPTPQGWTSVYNKLAVSPKAEVREPLLALSVLIGDPKALAALRATAADGTADPGQRRYALQLLVEKRPADLRPLLSALLTDKAIRGAALRGLAAYGDPDTPELILKHYAAYSEAEKADALATLAARPAWASALLDAMERGTVPRRDLSPFTARQMLNLKDKNLADKLNRVWGTIRQPAKDKTALLARYKPLGAVSQMNQADRSHGRAVFVKSCATCHKLFDEGAKIGPELTGAQRTNPEYILTKVLDPNAVVARAYQVTSIVTRDGRAINGLIQLETDKVLAVQTPTELIRLPKADIEERRQLPQSLMPEGLLAQMSDREIRDLLAYLAGPGQVALPKSSVKPGG